jgi:aryl-alcohol dehydrogenase-like predicted oxidoreductase
MINLPPVKLGFGVSGPLGQFWFGESKTRALIEQALASGIAHFDTAPFYFDAEKRLGAALQMAGGPAPFVSSKTGTRRKGRRLVKDFSERAIRDDLEQSLRSLGRDRLDLLYLHGPTTRQIDEMKPVLDALKAEGKVAAYGVCGDGDPLAHAARNGFDAIMGAYNVLYRKHEAIFAEAKSKGILTVAVAPLAQGLFDPKFHRPSSMADLWRLARSQFRGRYDVRQIEAAKQALGQGDLAGAALGFVLANPDIDIVMTTTTKAGHLASSLRARPLHGPACAALKSLALDHEPARS